MTPVPNWSAEHPDRLEWEMEQFTARGLDVRTEVTLDGLTKATTELCIEGSWIPITVKYPRHFPDGPPKFYAAEGTLGRHQMPDGGNLCVADEANWWPWMSAAEIVDGELRSLLEDTAAGGGRVAANEADMPEPRSALFTYAPGLVFLVPDPMWAPTQGATFGDMRFTSLHKTGTQYLVLQAHGFGSIDVRLRDRVQPGGGPERRGYWVHLDPPPSPGVTGLLERCREANPDLERRARDKAPKGPDSCWVGVRFSEEGPRRDEVRVAWLFAEVESGKGRPARVTRLAGAQALTSTERQRRIPELSALTSARVVLVGAGSLGAPVAVELAKAGVGRLDIYDDDVYDVNNAVRHVLPVTWGGISKAEAVAATCHGINPFIDVYPHYVSVDAGNEARAQEVAGFIREAHVVIDTTGVPSVSRLLQRTTDDAGNPLITAAVTAGGYGAEVLVSQPQGPCRDCLAFAQRDGVVPRPSAGEESNVTPVGCSHPAFVGAGFESSELAAVVARIAAGLAPGTEYPEPDFNWMVLNFRGEPMRQRGRLEIHADCRRH